MAFVPAAMAALSAGVTAGVATITGGVLSAAVTGFIGSVLTGVITGALTALVTGGDIGKGMLFGAIGGAISGGIGLATGSTQAAGQTALDGLNTVSDATQVVNTAQNTVDKVAVAKDSVKNLGVDVQGNSAATVGEKVGAAVDGAKTSWLDKTFGEGTMLGDIFKSDKVWSLMEGFTQKEMYGDKLDMQNDAWLERKDEMYSGVTRESRPDWLSQPLFAMIDANTPNVSDVSNRVTNETNRPILGTSAVPQASSVPTPQPAAVTPPPKKSILGTA